MKPPVRGKLRTLPLIERLWSWCCDSEFHAMVPVQAIRLTFGPRQKVLLRAGDAEKMAKEVLCLLARIGGKSAFGS